MRGWTTKGFALVTILLVCVMAGVAPTPFPSVAKVSAEPTVPYTLGNWTYVSKPVLPVKINASQIPVGSNWTYVYPLEAGSEYRVYCYGDWIDSSSEVNKTDYDIFVYDPSGNLESYHTEAAGLPEHLGTTVDHPFFIPEESGNYSFCVKNDPRESSGAAAATFMVMEHVDFGSWYSRYMEGKVNDLPVENTTWAYEFHTNSTRIEVVVDVPDTLDMYEARLYIMTNVLEEETATLNGVPLPWELALYGDSLDIYGGYNLDSDGLRYNGSLASCEYPGEDMLINFTAPVEGELLYHLVFIAEYGSGTIDFMVKTDFNSPLLNLVEPVERVNPNNETVIYANVTEQSMLEAVTLNYTTDGWTTSTALDMAADQNQIYNGTIAGQTAGTTVNYTVLARDTSGNTAEVTGSYLVKYSANLTLTLSNSTVSCGENIVVTASLPVSETNVTLTYALLNSSVVNTTMLNSAFANGSMLDYATNNSVVTRLVSTDSSGVLSDTYSSRRPGTWFVWADWNGTETYFDATSRYRNFTVQKTFLSLICNVTSKTIPIGDNITIFGTVNPVIENLTVTVMFTSENNTVKQSTLTTANGTYLLSWKPETKGLWQVNVAISGNSSRSDAFSNSQSFKVTDTWLDQYLIFILGGVGGVAGVVVVLFIRKRRYE